MNTLPADSLFLAKIYFAATGAIMIAGGVVGYVKAKSVASLVAGMISGIMLLLSAGLLDAHWRAGLVTALVVFVALAGRFVPALLRGKMMPAAYVAPLSVIGIVLACWLLLGAAHGAGQ